MNTNRIHGKVHELKKARVNTCRGGERSLYRGVDRSECMTTIDVQSAFRILFLFV